MAWPTHGTNMAKTWTKHDSHIAKTYLTHRQGKARQRPAKSQVWSRQIP